MKRKTLLLTLLLTILCIKSAIAQVNMQVFYDFGTDRKFVTMTLEMFKADKWGNTYFFIDHDFNYSQHDSNEKNNLAPGGTYLEISQHLQCPYKAQRSANVTYIVCAPFIFSTKP